MAKSLTLKERLGVLLTERQSLRVLLARYKPFYVTKHFTDERTALEEKIGALVATGLPFSEPELKHVPPARQLAECAFGLRNAFAIPRLLDNPAFVWDNPEAYLVLGFATHSWHNTVKQRLLDLCGPLDRTLATMLSA